MSIIYFNSHRAIAYNTETWRHIFSQWYNSKQPFIGKYMAELPHDLSPYISANDWNELVVNQNFHLREQFMMYIKALVFAKGIHRNSNLNIAKSILNTMNAMTIKALGRKVIGYDETIWGNCRFKVVVNGNYLEFTQNKQMGEILLSTDNRELVEASKDRIWAVGYNIGMAPKVSRDKWGQNLLGKAIMEVRTILQNL